MMHSINVTKENENKVLQILRNMGITPTNIYDSPETYSIISFQGEIALSLIKQLQSDIVISGTCWDWKAVTTSTQEEEEDKSIAAEWGYIL